MRYRRDIDDFDASEDDDLLHRAEAAERVRTKPERMAEAAERERMFSDQESAIRKSAAEFSRKASDDLILAGYRSAGVEPCPGYLVSWTIEDFGEGRMLVAPATVGKKR